MSQQKKALTVRSAEKRDAKVITQFDAVWRRGFDLDHFPVSKILGSSAVKRSDIRDNKKDITKSSGFLLVCMKADSIQTLHNEPTPYRIADKQGQNVVGILQFSTMRDRDYGNVALVDSMKILTDGKNEEQKKARCSTLLNEFLNSDLVKSADAVSMTRYFVSEDMIQEICGDLGMLPEKQYRLFVGDEIKQLQEKTAAHKAVLAI